MSSPNLLPYYVVAASWAYYWRSKGFSYPILEDKTSDEVMKEWNEKKREMRRSAMFWRKKEKTNEKFCGTENILD